MPLSGAERTRRYREKLKQSRPEELENQRKKNLDRIKSKKKKIAQLTPEEAEIRRAKWRKEKRSSRLQQKKSKEKVIEQDKNSKFDSSNATQENNKNDNLIRNLRKKCKFLVNKCTRYTTYNEKIKRNIETHRKRYQRLRRETQKQVEDLNLQIMKMKAREEILESALRKTYQNCSNRREKQVLKKLVKNADNKTVISKMLGLKSKVREQKRKLRRYDIQEIIKFYTRDDVSRNSAGKREVRTKNKEKVQIRYLLDALVNSFKKYKTEGGRYGFTTFYKNKPFFVLYPGLHSRSTCLCVKHSNFGYLHSAMVKNGLVTGSIRDILSEVSCDLNNYECMWNKCKNCNVKKVRYEYEPINTEKLNQKVEWLHWERQDHIYQKKDGEAIKDMKTKKTAKVIKKGTLNDLKNEFDRDLLLYKKHHFNMTHQQNQYQKAVSELKDNEAMVVCDFSENYEAKLSEEIQSMHYGASNRQICLQTGMVFWKNDSRSFCTLSNNTSHQPAAIWAHLSPVIDMIKRETPETTVIHFYSDGPSSQYRQKNNFYLLVHYTKKYQLQYTTWSFYEAGHGKNVADGIGGGVKRTLDRKVCFGNDITNAEDAYKLLKQSLKSTKVFIIDNCDIEKVSEVLPANVPVLKGTMQLHQIITGESFLIKYRDISCFCGDLRGQCSCFSPKLHSVVPRSGNMNNSLSEIFSSTSETSVPSTLLIEEIPENVTGSPEVENEPSLSLIGHLTSGATFDKTLVEDNHEDIIGDHKIEAVNENSLPLDLVDISLKPINIEKSFESINIIEDLTFFFGEEDQNNQNSKISADKIATSVRHIGGNEMQSFNWPIGKQVTDKKRNAKGLPCRWIDPKKVQIIPQNRRPPERLLTGTEVVAKKASTMIIEIDDMSASSSAKGKIHAKQDPIKHQGKTISESRNASKITFVECHKCLCSILSQKVKCITCKNWYCTDCLPGSIGIDNICDSCLED